MKYQTDVFRLHGKPLAILRIQNGLKAGDVAKVLNVTNAFISLCEKSERSLSESDTKKFIELIGITEDEAKALIQIVGK